MSKNTQNRNIFRRPFISAFLTSLTLLVLFFAWRVRPSMRPYESYNSFFPKEKFLEKVAAPVSDWMENQLKKDFLGVHPIRSDALERAYETIESRIREKTHFYHYRIIDNQLYKFIPEKSVSSSRDTHFEKAFKTLLSHTKVPNVDFILCPMDGIPEAYMPFDFYWMENPNDQVPILAQSKLEEPLTRNIILIPDQFSLSHDWFKTSLEIALLNPEITWEKKAPKAIWRGGLTDKGSTTNEMPRLEMTPRLKISLLSLANPDDVDAGLNWIEPPAAKDKWQTVWKSAASKGAHLQCKYLPVLDGHMCTFPGYQWRLLSNSVSFKQESNQIQWFYSALKPYEHYIPINNDMSDLLEKIEWARTHDDLVKQVSENAQKFASEHLMYEDCYRYLFLVLKKYASYQEIDFRALKKQMSQDPRWVSIQYRKRLAFFKTLRRIRERIGQFSSSKQS